MGCLLACLLLGKQYERHYDLVMMKQVTNYVVAVAVVFATVVVVVATTAVLFHTGVAAAAVVGGAEHSGVRPLLFASGY